MKAALTGLTIIVTLMSGCEILPVGEVVQDPPRNFCPPGQAKKGNCAPENDGSFCPPGQAKKGNC